jgi:hypothetical protein
VDGTGSGSCTMAGFVMTDVEPSGSATTVLISAYTFIPSHHKRVISRVVTIHRRLAVAKLLCSLQRIWFNNNSCRPVFSSDPSRNKAFPHKFAQLSRRYADARQWKTTVLRFSDVYSPAACVALHGKSVK